VGAVTAAAMVMRREVFEEVGGFDAESLTVAFNDVDLCIRIRNRGLMVLWTPEARLVHHESVSRGRDTSPTASARFAAEIEVMRSRWAPLLDSGDPFHSPNLANDREDGSLAFPPRYEPVWLD
jgi:GT2 family glycosyltransferase